MIPLIQPIHIIVNVAIYSVLGIFFPTNGIDLALVISADLIDIDHLFSGVVYRPSRNSFKEHPLHQQWKWLLLAAIIFLFVRPLMFLGIGLLIHMSLDQLENIRKGI